jgi:hypothetical protein
MACTLEPHQDVREQAVESRGVCMCVQPPTASSGAGARERMRHTLTLGGNRVTARGGGSAGRLTRERPRGVSSSSAELAAQAGQSGRGSGAPWLAVTGNRHYGQSSQGAAEPRPGRDGLGLPTHDASGYRQEPKHDTLPKLNLVEKIRELRAVILFLNLKITLSLGLILFASLISKLQETLASNNTLLRQTLHCHLQSSHFKLYLRITYMFFVIFAPQKLVFNLK